MARHRAIRLRRACDTQWTDRAEGEVQDRDRNRAGRFMRARTRVARRRWRCPQP